MTDTTKALPTAILPAVAKAMGMVHKLGKGERNKHDGYNFASIDDFLALVNPICAECGLIPHIDEGPREDFEKESRNGRSAWMRQSFTITLYHTSGENMPPVTRTVEVLRNGAQAYGSAQSYALKQYWRGLLLIPTGDKDDADYTPTEAGTIRRNPAAEALGDAWKDGVLDSLPADATPRQKAEAFAKALRDSFAAKKGAKALGNEWDKRAKIIDSLAERFPDLHEKVVDAYELRMQELAPGDGVPGL